MTQPNSLNASKIEKAWNNLAGISHDHAIPSASPNTADAKVVSDLAWFEGGEIRPPVQEPKPDAFLRGPLATYELIDVMRSPGLRSPGGGDTLLLTCGSGASAVQIAEALHNITVVSPSADIVRAANARILGSHFSVGQYLEEKDRDPTILRDHAIKPGIRYLQAPLTSTDLPSAAFSFVIIEQGHHTDLNGVIAEARRVLRPGGVVMLIGYMPVRAVPKAKPTKDAAVVKIINEMIDIGFEEALAEALSADERVFAAGYEGLFFPLDELAQKDLWLPHYRRRMFMRAAWTLPELVHHINEWPVTRRIEASGSLTNLDLTNFRDGLKKVWGSPKTRRVLNWPVALRIGRASS